jgi:hypothetical protein
MDKQKKSNKSKALNADEIAHHVSSMYITGPGGMMKETQIKRKKQKHNEHLTFLKKLDRHPTLVLNADYQVCKFGNKDTRRCHLQRRN